MAERTEKDLEDWLQRYGRAWETRDPDAAAALFSGDASYYETPFGPPLRGRDGVQRYWSEATGNQTAIHFSHQVICAKGRLAIARWQAQFTRISSGAAVRLDGIFLLHFDDQGLCRELREWWHRVEGE
jgi:ketosteroid isomerase-like protein